MNIWTPFLLFILGFSVAKPRLIPLITWGLLNITSISFISNESLQLYVTTFYLAGLLSFVYFILSKKTIPKGYSVFILSEILLIITAVISLISPILINHGKYIIRFPVLLISEIAEPLKLDTYHIMGIVYLLWGLLLSYMFSKFNPTKKEFQIMIKTSIWLILFSIFLGFYQLISFKLGIFYPFQIFNNIDKGLSVTEFNNEFKAFGLHLEASVFAQYIILCFPLLSLLPLKKNKKTIIILFLFVGLLITNSYTGYWGLITLIALKSYQRWRVGTIFATISSMAIFFYFLIDKLAKLSSYSALDRLNSITYAFLLSKQSPFIGYGIGSVTSHDLFIFLVSNIGLLGLTFFTFMIYSLFKIGHKNENRQIASIILLSGLSMWIISGFVFSNSTFWSFIIVCILLSKSSETNNNQIIIQENETTTYYRQLSS